ncbi:MAG: helix-turn-helix domain-containing protein [Pirellulaceae bacterium]|nr:helix-turn-helix domain-containing protein [Pirellulaceae bacterium]
MSVATTCNTTTIVLSRGETRVKRLSRLHPIRVSSVADVKRTVASARESSLWICFERALTDALLRSVDWPAKSLGDALIVHTSSLASMIVLGKCFRRVAFCVEDGLLRDSELSEALTSPKRDYLFIGGSVDHASETITLWRGNLEPITVRFSAFPKAGDGTVPDFGRFRLTDCGQTIKLGDYEASTDSILYEYDAEYRREVRRNREKNEKSFGACLRRLRKQRRLGRDKFAPLSEKTIARIERGEVDRVHPRTMSLLAATLQVRPEEINEY